MKVIIVGGGRMGSGLTKRLVEEGHEVTLIDRDEEVIIKLSKEIAFQGVTGVGFDKEVLEAAGIQKADALVTCTSSDENNALVARIAKNIYRVPRVIARLFDQDKADIYSTLGIETISTTAWGIIRASERIVYSELGAILSIGNEIEIVKVDVDALLAGRMVDEINVLGEIRVVAIHRNNKAFMPTNGSVLQAHDVLYISVLITSLARLKAMLGLK